MALKTVSSINNVTSLIAQYETNTETVIPSHLTSDYVEIAILSSIFLLGTPINVIVLLKLCQQYPTVRRHKRERLRATVLLFKLHLTVSNLLVLVLYCPTKAAWLISYSWPLGDVACKALHFLWVLAFVLSSNIVAAIAFDRALHVWRLVRVKHAARVVSGSKIPHCLLLISWLLAVVCALPQLSVFATLSLSTDGGHWTQCSTVWLIATYWRKRGETFHVDLAVSERSYRLFHAFTVCWFAFCVIVASYTYIVSKLLMYSCVPFTEENVQTNTETVKISGVGSSDAANHLQIPTRSVSTQSPQSPVSVEMRPCLSVANNRLQPDCNRQDGIEATSLCGSVASTLSVRATPSQVPAWRRKMRGRMFRTAGSVVLCYSVCWVPYCAILLITAVDEPLANHLDSSINWIKCFILLNAVVNPFLYRC